MADALARRIGPPVEQLRGALARDAPLATGRVRVGGAADVMAARIVPALAPLIRDGLDVEVSTGLAGGLLAELAEGRLDLVVSSVRPTGHQFTDDAGAGSAWRATALVDEEFLLVAAPTVAQAVDAARLEADPAEALATIPLAAYAADLPIIRRYWLTEFEQRPLQRVALVLPDLRGILRAVVAGVAASVLPRYLVDQPLADGALVRLHEPRVGPLNTLWVVTAGAPDDRVGAVQAHLLQQAGTWASM
jgi:DNA-binding transcriptional LysR family regulator